MKKIFGVVILAVVLLVFLFTTAFAQGTQPQAKLSTQYYPNAVAVPELVVFLDAEITPATVVIYSEGKVIVRDPRCEVNNDMLICTLIGSTGGSWELPLDKAQVTTCAIIIWQDKTVDKICETWDNPSFATPSPTATWIPIAPTRTPTPEATIIDIPVTLEPPTGFEDTDQPEEKYTYLPWAARN